jgi:DNA-binding MurR/RpiR family transcriptional regulator
MSWTEIYRTPAFLKDQELLPALRAAEKKVADYILQHGEEVTEMTVTEVAESSRSAMQRWSDFARKSGIKGFIR